MKPVLICFQTVHYTEDRETPNSVFFFLNIVVCFSRLARDPFGKRPAFTRSGCSRLLGNKSRLVTKLFGFKGCLITETVWLQRPFSYRGGLVTRFWRGALSGGGLPSNDLGVRGRLALWAGAVNLDVHGCLVFVLLLVLFLRDFHQSS